MRSAAPGDDAEADQHAGGADEPELLADHRVDEVGVRLGQVEQLLHAGHQALAEDAAGADGDQRLDASGSRRRADPPRGSRTRAAGGAGSRRSSARCRAPAARPARRRPDTGSSARRRTPSAPTMSSSEIAVPKSGCSRISAEHPADDDDDRQQRVPHLVDAVHPALEDQRGEQHRGDLGQLRRLDAEAADAEPAPRAVDRRAEQHGDEQQADEREQRPRRTRRCGRCGSRSAWRSPAPPGRAPPTAPAWSGRGTAGRTARARPPPRRCTPSRCWRRPAAASR